MFYTDDKESNQCKSSQNNQKRITQIVNFSSESKKQESDEDDELLIMYAYYTI